MGYKGDDLEVELVQFVTLYRGGEKMQMSTRSGEFDTLRQLRAEVGNDAARFYYVSRSNDQHLDFDLDVAKAQSNDNPVYYIQYAHARVTSVFRQLAEKSLQWDQANGRAHLDLLGEPQEKTLMTTLSRYPEVVELAANNRAPQHLVHFLRRLTIVRRSISCTSCAISRTISTLITMRTHSLLMMRICVMPVCT